MKLHFHADPGHGWLKVPRRTLTDLGIADKITSYSYQRGQWVYLEEDCDYSTFIRAAREAGIEVSMIPHSTDNRSRIRSYQSYTNQPGA